MSDDKKRCSRAGCGKTLRANNTTGSCATGCRSEDAPPAKRAKASGGAGQAQASKAQEAVSCAGALARFRVVAEALGKTPDDILEDFAQGWLDALRERLDGDT